MAVVANLFPAMTKARTQTRGWSISDELEKNALAAESSFRITHLSTMVRDLVPFILSNEQVIGDHRKHWLHAFRLPKHY